MWRLTAEGRATFTGRLLQTRRDARIDLFPNPGRREFRSLVYKMVAQGHAVRGSSGAVQDHAFNDLKHRHTRIVWKSWKFGTSCCQIFCVKIIDVWLQHRDAASFVLRQISIVLHLKLKFSFYNIRNIYAGCHVGKFGSLHCAHYCQLGISWKLIKC